VVQAGTQAQPADQVLDLAGVEAFVQAGRAEALGGEPADDLGVVTTCWSFPGAEGTSS
jgi:hypothetical protein